MRVTKEESYRADTFEESTQNVRLISRKCLYSYLVMRARVCNFLLLNHKPNIKSKIDCVYLMCVQTNVKLLLIILSLKIHNNYCFYQ